MNILILGSGGREHAFAHQIAKSSKCSKLFVAPGNAGTAQIAKNVMISVDDFEALKKFSLENSVEMIVVGPEKPLVNGIYDFFKSDSEVSHVKIIGPSQKGAVLEGSKKAAKEFMNRHQIPTAAYQSFTKETLAEGTQFLENNHPPFVLKADGLAAGKGVLILEDLEEAKRELKNMLTNEKFGEASQTVVIEEFLNGIELSVFALTDGEDYKLLPTAKDYKRIGEGDTGLNTGGMGAVSPAVFANETFMKKVEEKIVKPTINGLKEENIDFKGFVFFGLIKVNNEPYVIEYNVRMGDPETEVVLPRIKTDLVNLFDSLYTGNLKEIDLEIDNRHATTIMLVSGGYPEAYEKGKPITGLEQDLKEAFIFHSGTRLEDDQIFTNGGRVLAITTLGEDYKKALTEGYSKAHQISFDKVYYRKDIGKDLTSLLS